MGSIGLSRHAAYTMPGYGQAHFKPGAALAVFSRRQQEPAVMIFHYPACDRQTQSCSAAGSLGREEWLKNLFGKLTRNARAIVFDGDHDLRRGQPALFRA